MRILKKLNAALALTLTLALVSPAAPPVPAVASAQAAAIKLNQTKKTLKVGQTCQLKVTGTNKKVTWKSSKAKVATVSSKGKVQAKATGKTNITATVEGKKLTCKITVKAADNPALAKAPFAAKEVTAEGFSFVVPKDWHSVATAENGSYGYASFPTKEHTSHFGVGIQPSATDSSDYASIKEAFSEQYSEEAIKSSLELQGFKDLVISNFKTSDVQTQLGTAFYLYYEATATVEGQPLSLVEADYCIFVEDSFILINGIELPSEKVAGPTIMEAVDYIAKSIMKK